MLAASGLLERKICTYEISSIGVKYLSQNLRSNVLVGTTVGTFVWPVVAKFASFNIKRVKFSA